MGRVDPVRHVIIYVIPAETIVLMECNFLRYKASPLILGREAGQEPQAAVGQGDNLKGRERFSSSGAVWRGQPEVEGIRQIPVR